MEPGILCKNMLMKAKHMLSILLPVAAVTLAATRATQDQKEPASVAPEPQFRSELAKKARRAYRIALREADKAQLAAYQAARTAYLKVLDAEVKRAISGSQVEEALALRIAMRDVQGRVANRAVVDRLFRRVTAGKYQEFEWRTGQKHVEMLGVDEGFCYLSGITGALEGAGESVGVYRKNGKWMLGGTSHQPSLRLRAIAVRFRQP